MRTRSFATLRMTRLNALAERYEEVVNEGEILSVAKDDTSRELRLMPIGCPLRSPKWLPILLKLIWWL